MHQKPKLQYFPSPPHLARRPTTISGRSRPSNHPAIAATAAFRLSSLQGRTGRAKGSRDSPLRPKEAWGSRATSLPGGCGVWVGGGGVGKVGVERGVQVW